MTPFPYATAKEINVLGITIWAFRISYVGEQGWELYFPFGEGLKLWDALAELDVTPVGIETYANSRRLEKSLRLQNDDLEIDYNLYEAGLSRPKVKAADFHGKDAYVAQRELPEQAAYLCTFVLENTTDDRALSGIPSATGHYSTPRLTRSSSTPMVVGPIRPVWPLAPL